LANLRDLIQTRPKVLITGHTGFKGYWLIHLLKHLEIEAVGVSISDPSHGSLLPSSRSGLIREYFVDVRNYDSLASVIEREKPNVIVHFAAETLVPVCAQNPSGAFSVNVIGTVNVIDIAIKLASVQVIAISTTDKVYKNENLGLAFTEDSPLEGMDPYSGSKVAQENVIFSYRNSVATAGKKLLTFRSGNVVGGADFSPYRLLPDYIRSMATDSILQIRNPQATRPWQHVLDCLYGYLLAIQHASSIESFDVFNFGPVGKSLSVSEVLQVASTVSKIEIDSSMEPSQFYEAMSLDLNSTKSKLKLGWNPVYTQEESVKSTILWWKAVLAGRNHSEITKQEIIKFIERVVNE
jgi:CDP-glucose 4,6-dehydratase